MHIAYIHYLAEGASGLHHVHSFAQAARALGHEVNVYSMNLAPVGERQGTVKARPWLQVRSILKQRFSRYLHDPKEFAWNLPYLWKETALLQNHRPDVLLVRTSQLGISTAIVAPRLAIPLVLEVNAPPEEVRYYDEYVSLMPLHRWAASFRMKRAQRITVVSSALRDHLAQHYDVPAEKMTVVPNGADTHVFRPDTPPDAEYRANGRTVTVGFVGSFQKFHGTDRLADMIRHVASARSNVRFLLVGDGPDAGNLARMVGTRPDVHFTGNVPHERIPGLVACLDIGVMPAANFYSSPLKVFEWMAAGKAVVAPDYAPLREIISHGEHGILFPPEDRSALATAIIELLDKPDLRRRLGTAAAAHVRESFTWQHNAMRVLAACTSALSEPGPTCT